MSTTTKGRTWMAAADRCERELLAGIVGATTTTDAGNVIEGVAYAWGSVALGERGPTLIDRRAFDRSLAVRPSYPLQWQHRDDEPIGVAFLTAKSDGLHLRGVVADTQRGREALTLARAGALSGISLGFMASDVTKVKHEEHGSVRLVGNAALMECSLVSYPADAKARILAVDGMPAPRFVHAADMSRFERLSFALRTSGTSRDMFGREIPPEAAEAHRLARLANEVAAWNRNQARPGARPEMANPFMAERHRRAIEDAEDAAARWRR
jgi:HK97 family phage prohead protease